MISTVTISRMTSADVAIEHPDEWDDDAVLEAVHNRQIDIAAGASLWSGSTRTTVDGVAVGSDHRDELDTEYPPSAVELTDDDLDEAPAPVVEEAGEAAIE